MINKQSTFIYELALVTVLLISNTGPSPGRSRWRELYMDKLYAIIIFIVSGQCAFSQVTSFHALLDSGKAEFKRQAAKQAPDYLMAFNFLTNAVNLKPDNAEARYFLGYTIDRLNSDDGKNMHMSKKELTLKASREFEKVNEVEENYKGESIILDPYSKLTSIWGSLAQAYLTKNLFDSAKWAFQEGKRRGGFIEPILEFNRQLLNSCEKNAILITYGDNITIPSWYLQTIEKWRPDITVVDANLINAEWYPKYLKKTQNLKMSLADIQIDTLNYLQWSNTDITVKNPTDATEIFSWTLKPTYYDQYILKGDRILLDIFKQNLFTRDFYFSGVSDSTYNLFLTDYLVDDGIVSRLVLKKNDLSTTTTFISKNLDSYNINKLDEKQIKRSKDAIIVLNGFRWTYYGNSYFLYTKGQVALAKKLLDQMEIKFDVNKLPYDSEEFKEKIEELKTMLK